METNIRRTTRDDAFALSLIGKTTFVESYAGKIDGAGLVRHCAEKQSVDFYQTSLSDSDQAFWIVEANKAPIGYAQVCPPELNFDGFDEDDLELKRIYLLDRFQGQGLGKALLKKAEDHTLETGMKRLLIGVHVHNHEAIAFYQSQGYVQVGEHPYNVGGVIYDDPILAKDL